MATLQDMITRIGVEIRRPSLGTAGMTSQIAKAIFDAIAIYQKDRFRISDVDPSVPATFNTVASQQIYSVSANANIETIYVIDYLNIWVGAAASKLSKRTPEEILLLLQQNQQIGQPSDFAYQGNKILLYPIPAAVYRIDIGGHLQIAAPATLASDGVWMNWAEQLIRCHAKYELATHITRNPTMASAMSPDADGGPGGKPGETWRAWRRLKNESNKIGSVGRIRAMQW